MSVTPMGRAVPFALSWLVHLHMESIICLPRERTAAPAWGRGQLGRTEARHEV